MNQYIIQPATFRLDGGAMFGIIPRPLWSKVAAPDEENRIDLALRLWLIKDTNRVVLIDTGIGDYHDQKFVQRFAISGIKQSLSQALAQLGMNTSDVTDLVLSHLHFDHAGGLAALNDKNEIQLALPNAKVYLHKKHYEYALNPTIKDSGSFQATYFKPLIEKLNAQGKVIWMDGDNGVLIPELNLSFRVSHGHTPYLLHPYNKDYIYMADLVPTSHHVHLPWIMAYDISPGITSTEKPEFLNFIAKNNLTIIFEHDPIYWGATIGQDEKRNYVAKNKFLATEHQSLAFKLP